MALMNKIALTAAIAITIITLFGSSIVNNPVFAQAIGGSAGLPRGSKGRKSAKLLSKAFCHCVEFPI